jgi:hypothetical protein
MKSQLTKRKFYNKWLYKITLAVTAAGIFRHNTAEQIKESGEFHKEARLLASCLHEIKDYQLRIESKFIDIYVNDRQHVDEILSRFAKSVRHVFSPHPALLSGTVGAKNIVANKLPYDRYRYKVFLRPHTIKDLEEKKDYIRWLDSQTPRIFLSENTKDWFIKTFWNWDRRYMYVEDEKTLMMAKMRHSSVLGSVYTYQLTINN